MAGLAESLPIEERTVQAALAPQRLNFPVVVLVRLHSSSRSSIL